MTVTSKEVVDGRSWPWSDEETLEEAMRRRNRRWSGIVLSALRWTEGGDGAGHGLGLYKLDGGQRHLSSK